MSGARDVQAENQPMRPLHLKLKVNTSFCVCMYLRKYQVAVGTTRRLRPSRIHVCLHLELQL